MKAGAAGLYLGIGPSLRRYDLSDPSKPRLVAELDLDGAVVDMVLGDDWLAVSHMKLNFRAESTTGVTVVDISGPSSLEVIGDLAISARCGPLLAADGGRLAVASDSLFYLYQVDERVKPLFEEYLVVEVDTGDLADMALVGDTLVVAGGKGLSTLRIPR